jgi:predicted dehydrogenase/threonine dehydrogenase-like Zn-dependent dehydrogenase
LHHFASDDSDQTDNETGTVRQILQNLGSGETILAEVPCPAARRGWLRVATQASLLSLGTERMLVQFGQASLLQKARQQPDRVKEVLQKVRVDGFSATLDAVRSKLDQPLPLGYCNAGVIVSDQDELQGTPYETGQRVLSNGYHAEMVCVPQNLSAVIPEGVSDEHASFTVVASIGLQGIRLINPTIGETIVVLGLGLIGLLSVQTLLANGCRVIGIDLDPTKCALAKQFGAEVVDVAAGEDPVRIAQELTSGKGVDAVLITASTKSNAPLRQAAQMCRQRGRIVLVGVIGNEYQRADFYEKELSFQVSCSYGPGRYDSNYEEAGNDYPYGFVRWTQQRNFQAVLELMQTGRINPEPLISHRFEFDQALDAYGAMTDRNAMGIVLNYPRHEAGSTTGNGLLNRTVAIGSYNGKSAAATPVVGVIGAGNFTGRTLLPVIARAKPNLKSICSRGGVTGTHFGKKFGFAQSTTDVDSILNDDDINTVFITTQHNSHAGFVLSALQAGKHVFVEKPLCLTPDELTQIVAEYESRQDKQQLIVGFNRRFAPLTTVINNQLRGLRDPKAAIMTVNAGEIPADHWTQDPQAGGGRIIGEACHFIDLLRFIIGSPIRSAQCSYADIATRDTATISLKFEDGSIGTVHYFANGHRGVAKESLDIYCAGRVLKLDNFRSLVGFGWPGFKKKKIARQDKGHAAEVAGFLESIRTGSPAIIPFDEIREVTDVTLKCIASC